MCRTILSYLCAISLSLSYLICLCCPLVSAEFPKSRKASQNYRLFRRLPTVGSCWNPFGRRHARLHELQAPKLGEEACMLIRVSHHTPRLKPSCPAAEILPRTRPQLQGPPWTRQGSRRGWRGTSEPQRRVRERMMPGFRTAYPTAIRCASHPSQSRRTTPCSSDMRPPVHRRCAEWAPVVGVQVDHEARQGRADLHE